MPRHDQPLVRRLVGEFRAADAVADRVNARHGRLQGAVDRRSRRGDPPRSRPSPSRGRRCWARVRSPTEPDRIRWARRLRTAPRTDPARPRLTGRGSQVELEALLLEDLPAACGEFQIHPGKDPIQRFQHRDPSAQTAPDAAHFQPDVAGSDHDQVLGHLVVGQRFVLLPIRSPSRGTPAAERGGCRWRSGRDRRQSVCSPSCATITVPWPSSRARPCNRVTPLPS
jgi:hypothetical protein